MLGTTWYRVSLGKIPAFRSLVVGQQHSSVYLKDSNAHVFKAFCSVYKVVSSRGEEREGMVRITKEGFLKIV